jgi:hypothetical protein
MGLLRNLLLLPIKGPMDGALWVTRKIVETAETEVNNPATLRKSLQMLEWDLMAGRITDDEYDEAETQILLRLKALK